MAGEAQEVSGLKIGPQPVTPFYSDAGTTRGAEGMEPEAGSSWDPEPKPITPSLQRSDIVQQSFLIFQPIYSSHLGEKTAHGSFPE